MRIAARGTHNVLHGNASPEQSISNQRPMTAPGHCFGAHNRNLIFAGEGNQLFQGLRKFRRLHVIGVASEAFVTPPSVSGIRFRVAQSAEFRHVTISNPGQLQPFWQCVAIELGVRARAGNCAHIYEMFDFVRLEQLAEFFDGPGRVPNREYRGIGALSFVD